MKKMQPVAGAIAAAAFAGACAALSSSPRPAAPENLNPPKDLVLESRLTAAGFQVYECVPSKDDPARWVWVFRRPEADLFDTAGKPAGKHYEGPVWEAPDGSTVKAEVVARGDAPDAGAIPLLLLRSTANRGSGRFANVRQIQRLETVGGQAPAGPCVRSHPTARVPYKATYYFYVPAA
jgi:hypothetical protein